MGGVSYSGNEVIIDPCFAGLRFSSYLHEGKKSEWSAVLKLDPLRNLMFVFFFFPLKIE